MKRGFTFVEIILVIIIVGILAAIVIPHVTYTRRQAQIVACNANVAALNSLIEFYYTRLGAWPANLARLRTAGYINAIPVCPFNRAYSVNSRHRVPKHSH